MTEDCGTCRYNRGELPAPGGTIYDDGVWNLQHIGEPLPLVGWLVLKPIRHIESLAELSPEEAVSFGPLVRSASRVLTDELGCVKVYCCAFSEAEGFAHVHVHLIPRFEDTPPDERGPGVFGRLGRAQGEGRDLADPREAVRLVESVRRSMGREGGG